MTTIPLAAVRKTITVDAAPEAAFETFTRRIHSWWPMGTHSIFGEAATDLVFEERAGGRVFERGPGGEEAEWADVLVFEPPHRVVLRWRVNPDRGATEVEVRFTPVDGATRVELEHRGWDETGDAEGRASYDSGWAIVLDGYAAAAG